MSAAQPWTGRQLHFVGIGGAGMSGLARVALVLGASVSGSDRADSPVLAALSAGGATCAVGHAAENVPDGAEVVLSTAIDPSNPERGVAAVELHRADLLAELTRLKPAIAISGTHGKTTTTSMCVHALSELGLRPSYLVGGDYRGTNAAWDDGDLLVVEADESDRSLLKLSADVAVVTNAELDHHTTYRSTLDLLGTFARFVATAGQAAVAEPVAARIAEAGAAAAVDGGAAADGQGAPLLFDAVDVVPEGDGTRSRALPGGEAVLLGVPGEHNARNAAAALAALGLAGVDRADAAATLASFTGAGRRFERLGRLGPSGALVVDDYAHHPTEVEATLRAARELPEAERVVAVFQPHLYSRTAHEATGFGRALALADQVVVLGIYEARERQEDWPGVSGLLVAEAAADAAPGLPIAWLPGFDEAERHLRALARPGDVVLCLGAGDVVQLGRRLAAPPR